MHTLLISMIISVTLPQGSAPEALDFPHFPDRLHAFVWRNWTLAPLERMAEVVGAEEAALLEVGMSMGLSKPPKISEAQLQRTYITIIRANWHLLNYEQLLALLDWDAAHLAYTLREDDFPWNGRRRPTPLVRVQPKSPAWCRIASAMRPA